MVETRTDAEAKRKVWEMIREVEVAMMVTQDEEGRFRGRPMRASQKEFDGVLWFFTQADSPKVEEAREDERVLLAYSDPRGQNYVSIYGHAEVVRDAEMQKRLWSEPLRTWFPGGAEDPKVALLKVTCEGAEYWDAPSSAVAHVISMAKAMVTGKPANPGDNKKVEL